MILNNEINLYKTKLLMDYYGYDSIEINKKIQFEICKKSALTLICIQTYLLTKDPIFLFLTSNLLGEALLISTSHLEKYSLEYIKLRENYNYIIEEYNKRINNTFNFNDPVSISEAFIFAYKNGYLSRKHKFSYSANINELIENIDYFGASVFTGHACCRHISPLLNDIFESLNFDSTNLSIGLNTKHENEWKYDRDKVRTNHVINGILYNNESYYIDPTNKFFYEVDSETGRLINSEKTCEGTINDDESNDKKIKKLLITHPVAKKENISEISKKTIKICSENKDIFEHFYKKNDEIYKEISESNLIKCYRKK